MKLPQGRISRQALNNAIKPLAKGGMWNVNRALKKEGLGYKNKPSVALHDVKRIAKALHQGRGKFTLKTDWRKTTLVDRVKQAQKGLNEPAKSSQPKPQETNQALEARLKRARNITGMDRYQSIGDFRRHKATDAQIKSAQATAGSQVKKPSFGRPAVVPTSVGGIRPEEISPKRAHSIEAPEARNENPIPKPPAEKDRSAENNKKDTEKPLKDSGNLPDDMAID
ncbi:MAG: hypothetical protein PHI73_01045 [Patescibacteria group bacterium]|nr:hypothetical protein [Patescibacteria group bacterium]